MAAMHTARLVRHAAPSQRSRDFVAELVRALQDISKATECDIVWWVSGNISSNESSWFLALSFATSLPEIPLLYAPELNVATPGPQLVESWFSISGARNDDMSRLIDICNWDSSDLLLDCLLIPKNKSEVYRKEPFYKSHQEFITSNEDGMGIDVHRDNDSLTVLGSVAFVALFERSFNVP